MREQVKLFVAACLYYSGLVKLLRWWTERSGHRLIILNYHRAMGGDLRSHLLYLRRHYRLLHLEEALEELYRPDKKEKRLRDRRTTLVLTFDDGYRDNYTHGFAQAFELGVPITIFLPTGYIESGNCFWWMEAECLVSRFYAEGHAQVDEVMVEGRTYHLEQPEERDALARMIDTRLRYAASVSEREEFLTRVRKALAVPASIAVEETALPLNWEEVRTMEKSGWVSFGAHTVHHPVLADLRDDAELQREVSECRSVMEQQLGHPVRTFAYPIGGPEHIGLQALKAVREAGYEWAVTAIPGVNTAHSDPYQLRRIESGVDRHWLVLAAEIVGLWRFFARLRKRYTFDVGKDRHVAVSTPALRLSVSQVPRPLAGDGLVSSLHLNSERRPFRFGFTDRHIGHLDKVPVLSHRGPEDLRERSVAQGDQEHFPQAWTSCLEPSECSVGKEPVGELSLSPAGECLSLHTSILAQKAKTGRAQPPLPKQGLGIPPARREECLGEGER
jgi:peptidoglycan/xylan/chitin deacetylase (PgdA/CDA1 family)